MVYGSLVVSFARNSHLVAPAIMTSGGKNTHRLSKAVILATYLVYLPLSMPTATVLILDVSIGTLNP